MPSKADNTQSALGDVFRGQGHLPFGKAFKKTSGQSSGAT
jgi:hypothetical protein